MTIGQQLEEQYRAHVRERLSQVEVLLPEMVKEGAPEGTTGQLRAGIVMDRWAENGPTFQSTIRSLAPYSTYVDDGTGVFGPIGGRIYPINARALRFYWAKAGGWVAFASVAGSPGQHFFKDRLPDLYPDALDRVFG